MEGVGGGRSYLPLDGKASVDGDGGGGGCLNGLKLEGPNLGAEPGARPGPGGENGSIYGSEIGTTGGGKLLSSLLLLLSFGNRFMSFNLSIFF